MSKTKELSIDNSLWKDAVEVIELKNLVLDKMNSVYDNLWEKIGKLCGVINDFDKDFNVIMFESSDDVSGNINISTMTIIVKAVFKDGANYFPQVCLSYCKFE